MAHTDEATSTAAARGLLRTLAIGLSVHRLYPDNPNASTFVAACERIQASMTEALHDGFVGLEVRSGHFLLDGESVADPGIDRLAQACFERRVERLRFESPPTSSELWTWFSLLSSDPEELERGGGMAELLRTRGVGTIVTTARAPEPRSGEPLAQELLGLADWIEAPLDDQRSESLAELELLPGETGPELYERLRRWSDALPSDGSVRSSFFQRAAWVAEELPREQRVVFGRMLIDRLSSEAFAERFVGHLTDVALAQLIAEVAAHEGGDAAVLAAEVAGVATRHATLPRLFELGLADADAPVDRDDLEGIEVDHLRAGFPATPDQERALAVWALVDVLLCEPRPEHLEAIVANVVTNLRAALRAGTAGPVRDLLGALAVAAEAGPDDLAAQLEPVRTRSLDAALVAALPAADEEHPDAIDASLLAPFRAHAIAPLVDALAASPQTASRSPLLGVLGALGPRYPDAVVAALGHQTPQVMASLAPLLSRRTGVDVVPVLERVARRGAPDEQRVVIDALAEHDPERGAAVIASAARKTKDAGLCNHCLEVLAALPSGIGHAHLVALAARDHSPRLPRRARRRARRLARDARKER